MRYRLLTLLFAGLLVAACETTSEVEEVDVGTGEVDEVVEEITVEPESIDPTSERFVQEVLGDRVHFAFDSSQVDAEALITIRRWAEWMNEFTDVIVVLEGHCDERGTREYNLALGERRANAIKEFLVLEGVDPSRIATISYGKERPDIEGHNEAAWRQNRRGVLTLG